MGLSSGPVLNVLILMIDNKLFFDQSIGESLFICSYFCRLFLLLYQLF